MQSGGDIVSDYVQAELRSQFLDNLPIFLGIRVPDDFDDVFLPRERKDFKRNGIILESWAECIEKEEGGKEWLDKYRKPLPVQTSTVSGKKRRRSRVKGIDLVPMEEGKKAIDRIRFVLKIPSYTVLDQMLNIRSSRIKGGHGRLHWVHLDQLIEIYKLDKKEFFIKIGLEAFFDSVDYPKKECPHQGNSNDDVILIKSEDSPGKSMTAKQDMNEDDAKKIVDIPRECPEKMPLEVEIKVNKAFYQTGKFVGYESLIFQKTFFLGCLVALLDFEFEASLSEDGRFVILEGINGGKGDFPIDEIFKEKVVREK